ncbi:hypothetical protein MAR_014291 [Mya arenaria]|uniref:PHD-type domain-containing protein n=2 Tax=Mya arenaria TaxID=6604 RepID=A0ABY7G5K7_MYAAR|nr:hypothetical protein MAR_014291 [Mya arenaria]
MANQGVPASRPIVKAKVIEILNESGSAKRVNMNTGPTSKWFKSFLNRYGLSNRTAESMNAARASMSTEAMMVDKYDIRNKSEQIFNCDETGWTGKEKSTSKVIAPKNGHVFKTKIVPSGHITAHVCVSGNGRFLPSLVIFQDCVPHRKIEDVPESWWFAACDSGFMDTDIFHQWFVKCFIPHCGKARPVLLTMDNHGSHVSINTVKAAIENDVVLMGFPGQTTHILQPLDVKVFGPLKSRFATVCSHIGYSCSGVTFGKSKFPAVLRDAIDQAIPASVQRAFEVTGLCPVNREAIDKSQLIEPMFATTCETSETQTIVAGETCPTCGNYTTNPLVTKGLIPERLAKILVPPPVKPLGDMQIKRSKNKVECGRVISTEELLDKLVEREKQEEDMKAAVAPRKKEADEKGEAKLKDAELKKVQREVKKVARDDKIKRADEEKATRKRQREEKMVSGNRNINLAAVRAASYVCCVCGECGRASDEQNGIEWFGCNGCERWYHDHCLSKSELLYVINSLRVEQGDWYCKQCRPWVYEE